MAEILLANFIDYEFPTSEIIEKIKEDEISELPEPEDNVEEVLEEHRKTGCWRQYCKIIHKIRCEQAEKLGFKPLTAKESIKLMLGQPHTDFTNAETQTNHDFVYFHHVDEVKQGKDSTWGCKTSDYFRMEKVGPWYLPPFKKQEIWRYRVGHLPNLKSQIPPNIVLRIKSSNLTIFKRGCAT